MYFHIRRGGFTLFTIMSRITDLGVCVCSFLCFITGTCKFLLWSDNGPLLLFPGAHDWWYSPHPEYGHRGAVSDQKQPQMPHARRFNYVWLYVSCTPTYTTMIIWRCKCSYHVHTSTAVSWKPSKHNVMPNTGISCEYCNKRFYLLMYANVWVFIHSFIFFFSERRRVLTCTVWFWLIITHC